MPVRKKIIRFGRFGLRLLVAAFMPVTLVTCACVAKDRELSSEDALIISHDLSTQDHRWKLATAHVEKTLALSGGKFLLTSFINKSTTPAHEYIQNIASAEFRFSVNGVIQTGNEGGWVYEDSSEQKLTQGELQLDIVLRKDAIRVIKHYIVYPGTSIIREWVTLENAGNKEIQLDNLGFLETTLMSKDVSGGLQFGYFTGGHPAQGPESDSHQLRVVDVNSNYEARFSSTAAFEHLPLMILFDKTHRHGVMSGWDYTGPWAAEIGAINSEPFRFGFRLNGYLRKLKPVERIDMPKAFLACFAGDLDDMGNHLLDWQYQYLWQYKKTDYFARPRFIIDFDVPWYGRGGTEECWSRRLNMDLYYTDLARYAGAGVLWDDAGWYDEFGSWNGPDFSQTINYLTKYDMKWMLWFQPGFGYPGSKADRDFGLLLGGPNYYVDHSKRNVMKAFAEILDRKVSLWGDFQWRYDCNPASTDPPAADIEFRAVQRNFLQTHPNCGIDACMGGAMWLDYELAGYADSGEVTDLAGIGERSGYYTSMLVPPDILHDVTIGWAQGRKYYSISNDRIKLRMDPIWYADPGSKSDYNIHRKNSDHRAGTTLTIRPESIPYLESIRRDWDLYKYFVKQGVAGRWCHIFRPVVKGDNPILYFQRMDREGKKGVILTTRSCKEPNRMPEGIVTVYPKGLLPSLQYNIRFDFDSHTEDRSGAELMQKGITLTNLRPGEIVFLNLPNHPGSRLDKNPPIAPSKVTKRIGTNIFTQGVEVTWQPGTDDNWISYYEVFRISPEDVETNLGKVSQGTFYFDRSNLAMELIKCRYEVRTVDGDGNGSSRVAAELISGEPETHFAFSGYGPQQGFYGWSYELVKDGQKYRNIQWNEAAGYEGQWMGEQEQGIIARSFIQPHRSDDIGRVFTVVRAGRVRLGGCIKKDLPPGIIPSDQCRVRILKNDTQLWPEAGWQRIPVNYEGITYNVEAEVQTGDRIIHLLEHNPYDLSAGIAWNPVIQYVK